MVSANHDKMNGLLANGEILLCKDVFFPMIESLLLILTSRYIALSWSKFSNQLHSHSSLHSKFTENKLR